MSIERDWPDVRDYTGMCSVCGHRFSGCKFRIMARVCFACAPVKAELVSDYNVVVVKAKLELRAERGLSKYGVTTERTDLTRKQWLVHAQEEAMDLAVYLERLIQEEP